MAARSTPAPSTESPDGPVKPAPTRQAGTGSSTHAIQGRGGPGLPRDATRQQAAKDLSAERTFSGPRRKNQTKTHPPAPRSMSGVALHAPSDKHWGRTLPKRRANA